MQLMINGMQAPITDSVKVRQKKKANEFLKVLNSKQDLIDLDELRRLTFHGVPQTNPNGQADLRSLIWRILLGVLPLMPSVWMDKLEQNH